jgi:hypothetical protein
VPAEGMDEDPAHTALDEAVAPTEPVETR